MERLHTAQEIRKAVDEGKDVRCGNDAYRVIKDSIGQYLIRCEFNKWCMGLTGMKGTRYENTLNGRDFYVKRASS